jgi:serine protease
MNKKREFLVLGVLGILVIGSFSFSVFAQDLPTLVIQNKDTSPSAKFVPGQVIVGLKTPDPNFNSKASVHGGEVISSMEQINAHVVKVPINAEDKFINAISNNPNVRYVERDAIATASAVPNDPIYPVQWGMTRIGMESVWPNTFDLGSDIMVAVVDTGIYPGHPDFAGTTIRTDIDYDFVEDDTDTQPTIICIDQYGIRAESHATTVAGVIAATTNNGGGVAAIGAVEILPVRVLNQCGSGSSSDVADGIIHAALQGATVINLSLGSSFASTAEKDAIDFARADPTNAVVVAASGNGGNGQVSYPAGFDTVISVGAIASDDTIAPYSQFGNTLELSAPGGTSEPTCAFPATTYVVTPGIGLDAAYNPIYQYSCVTGTSFASPVVSGVAALLRSANPTAEHDEIRAHLQQTAEDLGSPGKDNYFGYGLVRADLALSTPIGSDDSDTTPPVITLNPTNPQIIEIGDPYVELGATATDDVDGDISNSIVIDSTDVVTSAVGNYEVTYNVMDAAGNPADEVIRTVTVEDNTLTDPSTIHVEDLVWQATNKKNWNAKVTITVNDQDHLPVPGVSVQGTFTGGDIKNCTTDGSGTCQVNKTTRLNELTFTVDSLSASGFESSAIDPHDLDGDSIDGYLSVIIEKGSSSGSDPPPDDPPQDPPQDKCTPGMVKKGLCEI